MKTNNYDMFKLREDNREKIEKAHVNRLKESIQSNNMLFLRPIIVNKDMEVIDGQHRLQAARELGVEIYYEVKKDSTSEDIILLNISKRWGMQDYLNYYCQNGYKEYQKLRKFLDENSITLKIALGLMRARIGKKSDDFKNGKYVFNLEHDSETISSCWDVISCIKNLKGSSLFLETGKFWNALVKLVSHEDYKHERFLANVSRLIGRIGPRATQEEYIIMLMDIYNWKAVNKIDIRTEIFYNPYSDSTTEMAMGE